MEWPPCAAAACSRARRTFAGCVKAQSPYSVNALAAVAARAAVQDRDYIEHYVAEVIEARQLVYHGFERLGIHYIPSHANFRLVPR